jgi:S-adenosylmethionine hydrolase
MLAVSTGKKKNGTTYIAKSFFPVCFCGRCVFMLFFSLTLHAKTSKRMKSNIITLTTDWGDSDNYAAIFKAHLYRENADARIVDVTHRIRKHAVADAAFLIKTMYHHYPPKSVHIIDVNHISLTNASVFCHTLKTTGNTQALPFTHHLAFCYDGHYFLCANNGIVTLFTDADKITEIVKIAPHEEYADYHTFRAIAYFAKAASALAKGAALNTVGEAYRLESIELLKMDAAYIPPQKENQIICRAQYIDSYGNIITNLHRDLFEHVSRGRKTFIVSCQILGIKQKCRLLNDYNESSQTPLVLFGHHNYLELSASYASMGNLLKGGLMKMQFVIDFLEK